VKLIENNLMLNLYIPVHVYNITHVMIYTLYITVCDIYMVMRSLIYWMTTGLTRLVV